MALRQAKILADALNDLLKSGGKKSKAMNDVEQEMINDPRLPRLNEELQAQLQNDGYDSVAETFNTYLESVSDQ